MVVAGQLAVVGGQPAGVRRIVDGGWLVMAGE